MRDGMPVRRLLQVRRPFLLKANYYRLPGRSFVCHWWIPGPEGTQRRNTGVRQ